MERLHAVLLFVLLQASNGDVLEAVNNAHCSNGFDAHWLDNKERYIDWCDSACSLWDEMITYCEKDSMKHLVEGLYEKKCAGVEAEWEGGEEFPCGYTVWFIVLLSVAGFLLLILLPVICYIIWCLKCACCIACLPCSCCC